VAPLVGGAVAALLYRFFYAEDSAATPAAPAAS